MTDLEKMMFIRARILEGKTKAQAKRECNKQAYLGRLNHNAHMGTTAIPTAKICPVLRAYNK